MHAARDQPVFGTFNIISGRVQ